jgi:hypothetical protein
MVCELSGKQLSGHSSIAVDFLYNHHDVSRGIVGDVHAGRETETRKRLTVHNVLAFIVAGFVVYLIASGNAVAWLKAAQGS